MDLYSLIKNKVMGVLDKQKNKQKQAQQKTQQQLLTQLSDVELKYLITLIGKSDFKGSDLQIIYSITAKLQNQLKK
jgi:hypothetical protein